MGAGGRGIIRPSMPGLVDGLSGRLDQLERPITSGAPLRTPTPAAVFPSAIVSVFLGNSGQIPYLNFAVPLWDAGETLTTVYSITSAGAPGKSSLIGPGGGAQRIVAGVDGGQAVVSNYAGSKPFVLSDFVVEAVDATATNWYQIECPTPVTVPAGGYYFFAAADFSSASARGTDLSFASGEILSASGTICYTVSCLIT